MAGSQKRIDVAPTSSAPPTLARRAAAGSALLRLQHAVGNRAVSGLVLAREPTGPAAPAKPTKAAATTRKVVLDANVFDQIARGNIEAANTLHELVQNADVYVSWQAFNEWVVTTSDRKQANTVRRIIDELHIKSAPPAPDAVVAELRAKNTFKKGKGTASVLASETDLKVAADAKAIDGEVWSFDRGFKKNTGAVEKTLGVKVAPETKAIERVGANPKASQSRALRILGIKGDPVAGQLPEGKVTTPAAAPTGGGGAVTETANAATASAGTEPTAKPSPAESGHAPSRASADPGNAPSRGPAEPGRAPAESPHAPNAAPVAVRPATTAGSTATGATAGELAGKLAAAERSAWRWQTATRAVKYGMQAWNVYGLIVEFARAQNMAAATLANGTPYAGLIAQGRSAAATAKGIQDYYNGLDLRTTFVPVNAEPPAGWDPVTFVSEAQRRFVCIEYHLQDAIDDVDSAMKDLRHQSELISEGMEDREEALLLPVTSLEYADAYLFADAGGRINANLAEAMASYKDARPAMILQRQLARAEVKALEQKMRELGGIGYFADIDTDDLHAAPLAKFSAADWAVRPRCY